MYLSEPKRELERKGGSKRRELEVWPAVRIQMREGADQEAKELDVGSSSAKKERVN
jgi:hypothetical protein